MRVLHVLHTSLPLLCGYSIRSSYIIRNQSASGLSLEVVTSAQHPNGSEVREVIDGVVHHRTLMKTVPRLPVVRELALMSALARRLQGVAASFKPDLVHAHSPVLVGWPAATVARRLGVPFVYEVRDLWENASVDRGKFSETSILYKAARGAEGRVLARASAVVTICDTMRGALASRVGDARRLFVVPNGVAAEEIRRIGHKDGGDRWSLAKKEVVGYIGTFQPYEGLSLLIQAMAKVCRARPSAHLLIVGGSAGGHNVEPELVRLAADLGVGERVTFAGKVPHSEVWQAYDRADVMVYPRLLTRTTALTTPLKPLEAMAMRRAVIVSDVPAMRELVDSGKTGVTFLAGDVDDLASNISALLQDSARRADLAAEGQRFALGERDWAELTKRYSQVYNAAISHYDSSRVRTA